MNPDLPAMLEDVLSRGLEALVLTNAMKPMRRHESSLLRLKERFGDRLSLRISIDHYTRELHELERGPRSWRPTLDGLAWLAKNGFRITVAGRLYSGETETIVRAGYARLLHDAPLDADDPADLVLFPEMDGTADVPEITESCWGNFGEVPGRRHVRIVPDGRKTQECRTAGGSRLYAPRLRFSVRAWLDARGSLAESDTEPSPLRQILRAGRRRLQRQVMRGGGHDAACRKRRASPQPAARNSSTPCLYTRSPTARL